MVSLKCPRCGCEHVIKAGLKLTVKGKKQLYQCKEGGHVFTKSTLLEKALTKKGEKK